MYSRVSLLKRNFTRDLLERRVFYRSFYVPIKLLEYLLFKITPNLQVTSFHAQ